jgi:DNA-binding MarR family transcriptional regulator
MTQNLSFEDVLDELMIEEPKPAPEALARWQKRYPQYHQALANFFETWAVQEARAQEPDEIAVDEDKLVQKGVDYAMNILSKQGRLLPDSVESLTSFDQLVLTAAYLLRGQGYPVNVTEKVGEMSGTRALLGSVLVSLDRLESKYLISSREIEEEGKTRRYFTVTLHGEQALAHAKETSTVVARFLAAELPS